MVAPKDGTTLSRPDLGIVVDEIKIDAQSQGMIAHVMLPPVKVEDQASEYPIVPLEALMGTGDTRRGMRGYYNRGDWEFETGMYATRENGWEEPLDDRERKLYTALKAETICVKRATGIVLRNQEKRVAKKVQNTSMFAVHNVGAKWTAFDAAKPLDDIKKGVAAIRKKCGMAPNTLQLTWEALQNLQRCNQISELIKFTFDGMKINNLTSIELAKLFGIPNVVIAGAMHNTANQAKDAELAGIWDPALAMLTITSDEDDMADPCIGRTFNWADECGEDEGGTIVEEYRSEGNRSDIYRVRHDTDERLMISYDDAGAIQSNVASNCSYLLGNLE